VRIVEPGRSGWVFVAAAALAAVAGALTRVWLPGAFASGAGAVVAVAAGAWTARGTSALQAGDERRRVLAGGVWLERSGRLPLVSELDDPVLLGVHPATAGGSRRDRCPAFVARDVSGQVCEVLGRERFVLLVGESTAGKSRAAYELIRAGLPGYRVVQPSRRDTAEAAAGLAARTRRSVLWLDDLERFLGSGGLTGAAIQSVLRAPGCERFIVATMRSEEYAKFSGRVGAGAEGVGRDVLREGWDVLRLAARVEVPRMWSADEIARAGQRHDDQRLAEAVRHAEKYGVAEYLAAAPQLLAEWRDAWAPAMHPRAAAMVLAAIDARRAGVHRPLPLQVLLRMHEPYLRARGGDLLRPEPGQTALEWATTPLYATSSLLLPAENGFLAFDYLIDAVGKDRIPSQALDALIGFSTPQESLDIGELAWRWSLTDQAEAAFRRAEAGGLFKGTIRRCHLIREDRGGHAAALRFARDAAVWTTAVYRPDHPQAFDALDLVAWETGHSGDPAAARRMLEDLTARSGRLLGADHKQTLGMRFGVAEMTGKSGDPGTAVQLYEKLGEVYSSQLGDEDHMTIQCRDQAAFWVRQAGDPARAARMYHALLTDMTGRFCSTADQVFGTRYRLALCFTEAGDHETALEQWERLINEAAAANGALWTDTLSAREDHARCIGKAGDPARAVRLLEALLADAETLNQPGSVLLLGIHCSLAEWTGETGNPAQAARQLRALLDGAAQQRGDDDPRVRSIQRRLTHWTAAAGLSSASITPPDSARHKAADRH
jgi:hypothetical protein